jgi:energy-coupling factor transporter ATP-binding protein EcfA2
MWLRSVKIANYQSLEDVELDGLGQFNVLIGRNNSGKSSVFGALDLMGRVICGESVPDANRRLTGHDRTRSLEMRLCVLPSEEDRSDFFLQLPADYREERGDELLKGTFLRQLRLTLQAPPGNPAHLRLREVTLLAESNQWAPVFRVKDPSESKTNPMARVTQIAEAARGLGRSPLEKSVLDVAGAPRKAGDCQIGLNWVGGDSSAPGEFMWLLQRVARYFREAFFFSPFRHSVPRTPAQKAGALGQEGSNLAQVLFSLRNNSTRKYREIETFVRSALPDLAPLMTPVEGSDTEVAFGPEPDESRIRLHEMGGGVEQLLMVATVLVTTPDTCTLFLEEPESHLHAGAQRFLIERLHGSQRQVFLTTHSPTFINLAKPKSLYQVAYANERTTISRLNKPGALAEMLEDIGARNSDLLLSDAVLFVEGPGDKSALETWSETLKMPFAEHNLTVLPMHGGEHASRGAPARSEVLVGISKRSPIPHLFLLDRDERSPDEIEHLRRTLGDKVCVLDGRELENYMLLPRALRAAIRSKCRDNPAMVAAVDKATDEEVQALIRAEAEKLHDVVLLKRIRGRLGGLAGGLLPREMIGELLPHTGKPDLANIIKDGVRSRLLKHLDGLAVEAIVTKEREALDAEWANPARHLRQAPGEEVVAAVYTHFGTTYSKPADTKAIAREMQPDEIGPEFRAIINRAVSLVDRSRRAEKDASQAGRAPA